MFIQILKRIKEFTWFRKISFWMTLLLAVLLWFYINLNDTYKMMVNVPLYVTPPKGRAIEQQLQNTISIEMEGSGWNLLNYVYLNQAKRCNIHLDSVPRDSISYIISSLDFQKGLDGVNKISPRRFYPPRLNVTTDEIEDKRVNVKPDIIMKLKPGFVLVGSTYTDPESILISGNKKSLENITEWKTMNTEFNNVNASFNYIVNLSDSLNSIIKLDPNKVKLYGEVQQYGEITFDDITLKIIGGQLPNNHIIIPNNFKITLSGGIEYLKNINTSDIELTIDYDDVINDTVGLLIPALKIPPFTIKMNIEPKFIHHKILYSIKN